MYRDLEALIHEGRTTIDKQILKQKNLLERNFATLQSNLDVLHGRCREKMMVKSTAVQMQKELVQASFIVLEKVAAAESAVCSVLAEAASATCPPAQSAAPAIADIMSGAQCGVRRVVFAVISETTPEFQYMQHQVMQRERERESALSPSARRAAVTTGACLLRLFRVVSLPQHSSQCSDKNSSSPMKTLGPAGAAAPPPSSSSSQDRLFTVLTPHQLCQVLEYGWSRMSGSGVFAMSPGESHASRCLVVHTMVSYIVIAMIHSECLP